ncbi:hypothetical protein EVAR_25608_1 [Eumeta japonica]|uniref:Uncharacterized protein n=1 Tax=Eumeta variegata TaxID=151549 RepID=A0A4C1V0S3_EUMVA|nr:hypothetical protein EVAR_25608_1 [Eumeta japonica]
MMQRFACGGCRIRNGPRRGRRRPQYQQRRREHRNLLKLNNETRALCLRAANVKHRRPPPGPPLLRKALACLSSRADEYARMRMRLCGTIARARSRSVCDRR